MRTHRHAVESVLEWLPHHGQQLTRLSLKLGLSSQLIRQLPCQHLLELKLLECDIQLGAADGFPGVIEGCSKLTRLELECNILDATESAVMDGLSSLVHLQHLVVAPAAHKRFAWQDEYVIAGLSGATLPRLQHLTCLKVNELSTENLLQLSILANLQELHLATGWLGKNISEVSGLVFPASLKTLVLFSEVEAEARVLSLVPPGLQDLRVDGGVGGPDEGPDSFLSCVSGLKHLTRLSLGGCNIVDWPVAGPAYSALTASSNLAVLEMYDPRFPPNIWPYVFAPTQKLPCLTSLYLWGSDGNEPLSPPPWSAADLSSIINCCPNLCELEIDNLEPGVRVSELHKLTTLTRLRLGHDALRSPAGFDGCVRDVASVTQLRQVQFSMYGLDVTAASLLPLTSLTALTSLTHDFGDQIQFSLRTSTQAGSAPDVWLQLLERCATEPGSLGTVLRCLAQQLLEQKAQLRQEVSDLQDQSTQQQQILAKEQLMNAQQEQRIAGLQEQLSAQQQKVAEQGAINAELQAQASAQQQVAAQQGAQIAALQELLQQQRR